MIEVGFDRAKCASQAMSRDIVARTSAGITTEYLIFRESLEREREILPLDLNESFGQAMLELGQLWQHGVLGAQQQCFEFVGGCLVR